MPNILNYYTIIKLIKYDCLKSAMGIKTEPAERRDSQSTYIHLTTGYDDACIAVHWYTCPAACWTRAIADLIFPTLVIRTDRAATCLLSFNVQASPYTVMRFDDRIICQSIKISTV